MNPIDFVGHPVPDGVEVEWAGKDIDLGELLVRGEIDALISAETPKAVLDKNPAVGRLFEDDETIARWVSTVGPEVASVSACCAVGSAYLPTA